MSRTHTAPIVLLVLSLTAACAERRAYVPPPATAPSLTQATR